MGVEVRTSCPLNSTVLQVAVFLRSQMDTAAPDSKTMELMGQRKSGLQSARATSLEFKKGCACVRGSKCVTGGCGEEANRSGDPTTKKIGDAEQRLKIMQANVGALTAYQGRTSFGVINSDLVLVFLIARPCRTRQRWVTGVEVCIPRHQKNLLRIHLRVALLARLYNLHAPLAPGFLGSTLAVL